MLDFNVGQVFFYPDVMDNLALPENERLCVHYNTMTRAKHAQYARGMNPKQERAQFLEHVIKIENLSINGTVIKTAQELYDHPQCPPVLISEISRAVLGTIPPATIEEKEKNSDGPSAS